MARPTTRDDLLLAASDGFAKLTGLIDHLPAGAIEAEFAFEDRDRNVRDVLWHLHTWHGMVIEWHLVGTVEGGVPAVPGEGYTWKTLPLLNQEVWEKAQLVPLSHAREAFEASHTQVVRLIESHTNDELFSRGVYPWTKSTTLGAYFISATSSHYDWAMKKLHQHRRTYAGTPS
ncbi:MAG: ClbS/DfsB family four-helix bundle protein [Bifidobacteriaceae bacterium]|jgi:hypothetical protein|nr:ClbS/DfsB family four-helix bundle protein [Bifidobacteriaceae bacterium]